MAVVPAGGVSFLYGISAIGTKFHPSSELGPKSQPASATGSYRGVVWLRARPTTISSAPEPSSQFQ